MWATAGGWVAVLQVGGNAGVWNLPRHRLDGLKDLLPAGAARAIARRAAVWTSCRVRPAV